MKNLYEIDYWYENCPMLNPTIKKFFVSNKKFLFVFCDYLGEYRGEFFDDEPEEDIFIKSAARSDLCGAIFERDFSKTIDIEDNDTLLSALILIDEDIY